MHLVIEFLPVYSGLLMAGILKLSKAVWLTKASVILLGLVTGFCANLFSGEGPEFLIADLVSPFLSAFCFVALSGFKLRGQKG